MSEQKDHPDDLAGQVALITGAAGGIGGAIASRLLQDGGRVVLTDINTDGLALAAEKLANSFGADQVFHTPMNVTQEASVADAFSAGARFFLPHRHSCVERWHRICRPLGANARRRLGSLYGHPGQGVFPCRPRSVAGV